MNIISRYINLKQHQQRTAKVTHELAHQILGQVTSLSKEDIDLIMQGKADDRHYHAIFNTFCLLSAQPNIDYPDWHIPFGNYADKHGV